MGEAELRGSFEERKAMAAERKRKGRREVTPPVVPFPSLHTLTKSVRLNRLDPL